MRSNSLPGGSKALIWPRAKELAFINMHVFVAVFSYCQEASYHYQSLLFVSRIIRLIVRRFPSETRFLRFTRNNAVVFQWLAEEISLIGGYAP